MEIGPFSVEIRFSTNVVLLAEGVRLEEDQIGALEVFLDEEDLSTTLQIHRLVINLIIKLDHSVFHRGKVVEVLVSQSILLVVQAPILSGRVFQFLEIGVVIDFENLCLAHDFRHVFHLQFVYRD